MGMYNWRKRDCVHEPDAKPVPWYLSKVGPFDTNIMLAKGNPMRQINDSWLQCAGSIEARFTKG